MPSIRPTSLRSSTAFRAADPEVKLLGIVETDWYTIKRDSITNGNLLPPDSPAGTPWLTAAQSQIIRDAIAAGELPNLNATGGYTNSLKTDKDGNFQLEIWSRDGGASHFMALAVYPEVGNYQYEFLQGQVDFLINTMGMDGVYFDQFSMVYSGTEVYEDGLGNPLTDGYTGTVNPITGSIDPGSERYDANLAGISARVNLLNSVTGAGKTVVANTYSSSAEEQALKVNRFSEVWNSFDVMGAVPGPDPTPDRAVPVCRSPWQPYRSGISEWLSSTWHGLTQRESREPLECNHRIPETRITLLSLYRLASP